MCLSLLFPAAHCVHTICVWVWLLTLVYKRPLNLGLSFVTKHGVKKYQWALIKDIIVPAPLWPHRIRVLFLTRNLTHFQRFLLACFVFVNGLSPDDFMHWSDLMHLCRNLSAREHLVQLFQRFERGGIRKFILCFQC